ncbi:HGxxPAAW family protein [Kytococcus sp. Marseille-QA3725]
MTQAHSAPHGTERPVRPPEPEELHDDHGHSVAAWTGTILMILGSILVTAGIVAGQDLLIWIGVIVTVVGALAWPIMAKMGFGNPHAR